MVFIYTCGACQHEQHEKCERGHSVPKGTFGGSTCVCGCRGRSKEQWDADDRAEMEQRLRNLDI